MEVKPDEIDKTTQELLGKEWEDIYSIVAKLKESKNNNPEKFKAAMKTSPAFLRAVFQALVEIEMDEKKQNEFIDTLIRSAAAQN